MYQRMIKVCALGVLSLVFLWLSSATAQAATVTVNLCAKAGVLALPGGGSVNIWGFADNTGGGCTGVATLPGPLIQAAAGDTVVINLANALSDPVSILIPGQTVAVTGGVAGTFTTEAPPGGSATYTINSAASGTYLYESGSNASIQAPMGLYGPLVVASSSAPYTGIEQEAVLVLSEIDPNLHANPATFNLLNYKPTYFLINGQGYPNIPALNANPGDDLLLRYVNAGFDHYAMALLGTHQRIIARDGSVLPTAFWAVAETVPAGQTLDALVSVPVAAAGSTLKLYNRNMYVTNNGAGPGGMRLNLNISTVLPPPATATPTNTPGSLPPTPPPTPTPTNTPAPSGNRIYVSSSSGGTVGGVAFDDEDILVFDTGSNTWSMLLDLSDVGVTANVDAFAFTDDGNSVLVSFATDIGNFPGALGAVDDSDILKFTPTSWGLTTAGPDFTMYFDGSDVGLTTNEEDIDALHLLPDGRLVISTLGNGSFSVPGPGGSTITGNDEDLLIFTPTSLGDNTSGTWAFYFDGSDVGLTAGPEDIWGVWQANATSPLYLSTEGNFSVTGLSGDDDDIFICTPGSLGDNTTCTFSFFWNGGLVGFGPEQIDGISVNDGPVLLFSAALDQGGGSSETEGPTEPPTEDAEEEEQEEEAQQQLYLPLVTR